MLGKLGLAVFLIVTSMSSFAASWNKLYKQTLPATVTVYVQDADGKPLTQGSGVSVRGGKIATNCHVIKDATYIIVADNIRLSIATVWGGIPNEDLCLLTPLFTKFPTVKISNTYQVGDEVFLISGPLRQSASLSVGIVSQIRANGSLIQTSAPMSPGSSGGGLFNNRGELIGIATYITIKGQNLNFAVSASIINRIREGNVTFVNTPPHIRVLSPPHPVVLMDSK